jgi:hypothetical protein
MPRYFFHLLHPQRDPVLDDEGSAFEDDTAAKREGMASLGDFLKEASLSKPMPRSVSVQIVREGGSVVDLLTGHISAIPPGQRTQGVCLGKPVFNA